MAADGTVWPPLVLSEWNGTRQTLHMWTQVVGKIRLQFTPHVNHWWQVPLYVSARGLTTSPIPYGHGIFEMTFDFIDHVLLITTSGGLTASIALKPQSVADFYRLMMSTLRGLNITPKIWTMPVEVEDPIRFEQDRVHASYDAAYAQRFWRVLVQVDSVLKEFRARFLGKSSPVHFFWGSFDMAVTRFSGRQAPERPGADAITREAYSHEVISCGFWPGGTGVQGAAFYCYAAPEPPGLKTTSVRPTDAFYSQDLSEFLLMYDAVRTGPSPRETLLEFFQSTYDAAATLAHWNRDELERRQQVA